MKLAAVVFLAGCADTQVSTITEITQRSRIREISARTAGTREPSAGLAAGPCARLSWPVDAPLSSPFGPRDGRAHDGIDLAAVEGTPVRAACDGVVAYAGDKLRGYGKLVILAHAGLVTVYAHNRALVVKEGDAVARGQEIARSGATGHVTAPHLHFEVRRDNRPDDPLKYLPPRAQARQGAVDGRSHRAADRPHP
jgi:murein DD-endopeptidase MepM/ murein hydrolase activator NlpD